MTISNGLVFSCRNLGDNLLSLKDDTGRHTLTNTNVVRCWSPFGAAAKFNGTSAYISAGDLAFTINTIECILKPVSIAVTEELLDLNGTAYVKITNGVASAQGFTSPTIYVNGVSGATSVSTSWNHLVVTTATAVDPNDYEIGELSGSTFFNGIIATNTLWSRVLTTDEITSRYLDFRGKLRAGGFDDL